MGKKIGRMMNRKPNRIKQFKNYKTTVKSVKKEKLILKRKNK